MTVLRKLRIGGGPILCLSRSFTPTERVVAVDSVLALSLCNSE